MTRGPRAATATSAMASNRAPTPLPMTNEHSRLLSSASEGVDGVRFVTVAPIAMAPMEIVARPRTTNPVERAVYQALMWLRVCWAFWVLGLLLVVVKTSGSSQLSWVVAMTPFWLGNVAAILLAVRRKRVSRVYLRYRISPEPYL